MKVIRNTFIIVWTLFCIIGMIINYSLCGIKDCIVLIPFLSIPYIVMFVGSVKKQKTNIKQIEKTEILHPQYVETNNVIYRTDGKPIQDEEVPYLIQLGYEKALNAEKISTNPKFHRTEREEELSFQFFMKHGAKADLLSDDFMNLYGTALKTTDLSEQICLFEKAVIAFEKARKFCYSKGKGGTIYFQDMWESISYLDRIIDSLEKAKQKRDVVIPGVINIIRENEGILQKNIYSFLPETNKSEIQSVIRLLESDGYIIRIKKNGSYELHTKKE